MQLTREMGWTMRKIKAKRSDVLNAIRANYEAHKKNYADAFDGYKVEALEQITDKKKAILDAIDTLGRRVAEAVLGKDKPVALQMSSSLALFTLTPPVDHSRDYEVVIKMLEFSVDDEIELEQDQFECYVMDRWDWADSFRESVTNYRSKLAPKR